jgi:hypothetical protein
VHPGVEALFPQHFRRDLRAGRFTVDFVYSVSAAFRLMSAKRIKADVDQMAVTSAILWAHRHATMLVPVEGGCGAALSAHAS